MPMSKLYSFQKGILALFVFVLINLTYVDSSAQSITCFAGLRASLDDSCKVVIDAFLIAPGEKTTTNDADDYEITVKTMDGSTPSGVYTGSGADYKSGTVGSIITFTEPGAYTLSVKNLTTRNYCWGDFYVEDKLAPLLVDDCKCPAGAEVIDEECTFTCASILDVYQDSSITSALNPKYLDNCGNTGDVFFTDEIVNDTLCGSWYIMRTWKTKLYTAHGGDQIKDLACKQKFLFEGIDTSAILPPKSKVIVECGIDTDPQSLRNYFSDTSYFDNPNLDSAVICSYPHVDLGFTITDSTLVTNTLEKDSIHKELVELIPGTWSLVNVVDHYTIDSSYYIYSSYSLSPIGLRGSSTDIYCKMLAVYTDTDKIFPKEGCLNSYKFVRTWKMVDWCSGKTRTETQIIAVMDLEAPTFAVSDTLAEQSTNPWFCGADVIVPAPIDSTLSDNCTDKANLSWSARTSKGYKSFTANASNGYKFEDLSIGEYEVIYEVADECGNVSRDTSYLKIVDGSEPVAITKDKIIVTFTQFDGDCTSKIFPQNIDVGSYDACSGDDVILEIKRLTDTLWAPFVKFSQADIMSITESGVPFGEHMVELRVTDMDNNSTIGWTTVRVEDKNSQMYIDCGTDSIFVDCAIDFESIVLDSLYAPKASLQSCTTTPLDIDYKVISGDINTQCNVGKTKVAYFISGGTDTICIKDFVFGNQDTLKIEWPEETITVDCADGMVLEDPIVTSDGCHLLAESVESQEFDISNGTGLCKKIIRTFTIIDWCSYRPNTPDDTTGIYKFRQVIHVKDEVKPVVECVETVLEAGSECGLSGFELSAMAVDTGSCADGLSWEARIDIDGDDVFETLYTPFVDANGIATITVDTLLASGTYNVWWRATDQCRNKGEQICTFVITDTKAPTPQCISTISTALMNTTGTVAIWAKDYDLDGKSTDECGGRLYYSFSGEDRDVSSLSFSCDDLPNGISTTLELRVYVWDESGNKDFCNVQIRLDDNADVCTDIDQGMSLIAGSIQTVNGDNLESAEVKVSEKANRTSEDVKMTSVEGVYAFTSNPMYYDYELSASKKDDVSNGVSTLDIILIQQHILARNVFDSPYKVIAADVSGDQKVSAIDLVEIRKIILGASTAFSSGKSWNFVSADQTFNNVLNPWPLQEHIELYDVSQHYRDQDFVAIKLGDVNGNAIANSLLAGTRSEQSLTLYSEQSTLHADETEVVKLHLDHDDELKGIQLRLKLNEITVHAISINDVPLNEDHYFINENILTIATEIMDPNQAIDIELQVISSQLIDLDNAIEIVTTGFSSEAYAGDQLETFDIELHIEQTEEKLVEFDLYQNKPNPFTDETSIGFFIGASGMVELSVFDATGKQLYQDMGTFEKGENFFTVRPSDLKASGVMYYQISSGDNIATKKMIRLE